MQPKKKQFIIKSTNHDSGPMAHYLSNSSSSIPPSTSSFMDLMDSLSSIITSTSTNQKSGGKTSYIWNHGKKIVHEGKDRWKCNHCICSYAISGSATTNSQDHLHDIHGISDPNVPVDTKQSTLDNYRRPPIHLDVLRKLIIKWIVEHHHSFNETESEALHRIFEYLDPRSTNTLMSRNTLKADVDKYFKIAKAIIKEHLSLTRS